MKGVSYAHLKATALPQELVDYVVGYLHDDKPSLVVCSVLSRTWLRSSRHHLFYTIRVSGLDGKRGFAAFFHILTTSPNVGCWVQELHLLGCQPDGFSVPRSSLDNMLLVSILSNLPTLHTLKLNAISWRHVKEGNDMTPYPPKPLRKLVLEETEFHTQGDAMDLETSLCHFLCLFSTVGQLHAEDVWLHHGYDCYASCANRLELASRGILSHLQVTAFSVREISWGDVESSSYWLLEIVRLLPSVTAIHSLDIYMDTWETVAAVQALARDVGHHLHVFRFDAGLKWWMALDEPKHEDSARFHVLDLSACAELRSISVHFHVHNARIEESQITSSYIFSVLSSLAPSVRHITMDIENVVYSDSLLPLLESLSWNIMNTVVKGLGNLESITFELRHFDIYSFRSARNAEIAVIQRMLPAARAKGLLQFTSRGRTL